MTTLFRAKVSHIACPNLIWLIDIKLLGYRIVLANVRFAFVMIVMLYRLDDDKMIGFHQLTR